MTNSSSSLNLDLSRELHTFLRLLNYRKLTVIVVAFVIFLMVAVGTFLQTPVYRATATITIDMETASLLAIYTSRDDATMAQTNYLTYADYYRTQIEILKSRRIAEIVYANLNLSKKPQYSKAEDPIKKLMSQFDIEPVKQTRLVLVRVNDKNPKRAEQIANEAARVFVNENLRRTTRSETLNLMKNEYLSLQSKEAELSKRYKPKFPARLRVHNQMEQLALAIKGENIPREGQSSASVSVIDTAANVQSIRPNNIWVQTPAHVPLKPIKPNKVINLWLGLLFGIVAGIAVAAFEEFLDGTIKSSGDITDFYQNPFLGHIPEIQDAESSSAAAKLRYQLMHTDSQSEIAESYRTIRTNLLCIPQTAEKTALLISSPGSSEGKTTTTCNLAIALAHTGVSVLVVDADLRKPNIYKAFELPQTPGLSEFLSGKASFQNIINTTAVDGLSVVTSGAIPKNPAELLGSLKMREFHKLAVDRFDYVLIDTAPMIPVTDATILAAMTQKVLAVAQSGKTPRAAFKQIMSICDSMKVNVVGIILNKVPRVDVTGYGYGYQIYQYGKPSEVSRPGKNTLSGFLESRLRKAKSWYSGYLKKRQG